MRKTLMVALGVTALAIPAGAVAKQGENHGKANGHNKPHAVAYIFKGVYTTEGAVEVKSGNSRVRKGGYIGQTVTFDLTNARIVVSDTNNDGQQNLSDVVTGDNVLVMARLPRTNAGSQPFAAKRLVDQTNEPASTE